MICLLWVANSLELLSLNPFAPGPMHTYMLPAFLLTLWPALSVSQANSQNVIWSLAPSKTYGPITFSTSVKCAYE